MQGSLINRLGERSKQPDLQVGMGITIYSWSDRSAGTIQSISKSGKSFTFRYDKAVRTDKNGMSDCQQYKYEPIENGTLFTAFKTKNGSWKIKKDGRVVGIGYRDFYHDWSF